MPLNDSTSTSSHERLLLMNYPKDKLTLLPCQEKQKGEENPEVEDCCRVTSIQAVEKRPSASLSGPLTFSRAWQ